MSFLINALMPLKSGGKRCDITKHTSSVLVLFHLQSSSARASLKGKQERGSDLLFIGHRASAVLRKWGVVKKADSD